MTVDDDGCTARNGLGQAIAQYLLLGYANNTAMAAHNHLWLQNALDLSVDILWCSGFEVNIPKQSL